MEAQESNPGQENASAYGCYALLRDAGRQPVTRSGAGPAPVYKAYHRILRCHAALRAIPPEAFGSPAARDRAAAEARAASRLRHPNLASVLPPENADAGFLYATEFCAGQTLADRLADEGTLPEREALAAILQIVAALDAAFSWGLPVRDLSPANILLGAGGVAARLLDLALPPGHWREGGDPRGATLRAPEVRPDSPLSEAGAAQAVAALLYAACTGLERYAALCPMAAGERAAAIKAGTDFEPGVAAIFDSVLSPAPGSAAITLPALRELIEAALRAPPRPKPIPPPEPPPALPLPEEESDMTVRHLPREAPSEKRGLEIPQEFLAVAQTGTLLKLEPAAEGAGVRITGVGGNLFWIGRSATAAHMVTQFDPEDPEESKKTRMLSRIHVTGKYEEGKVMLVDGDGTRPSGNGSSFECMPLSAQTPMPLTGPGELRLADEYVIRAAPLPFPDDGSPAIRNVGDWKGLPGEEPLGGGAILFAPVTRPDAGPALWLLSGARFSVAAGGMVDFEPAAGAAMAGALHYWSGCFWIEAISAGVISVNSRPIAARGIVPLAGGQVIEIGGVPFNASVA